VGFLSQVLTFWWVLGASADVFKQINLVCAACAELGPRVFHARGWFLPRGWLSQAISEQKHQEYLYITCSVSHELDVKDEFVDSDHAEGTGSVTTSLY
jgi:hypothetical protein